MTLLTQLNICQARGYDFCRGRTGARRSADSRRQGIGYVSNSENIFDGSLLMFVNHDVALLIKLQLTAK